MGKYLIYTREILSSLTDVNHYISPQEKSTNLALCPMQDKMVMGVQFRF